MTDEGNPGRGRPRRAPLSEAGSNFEVTADRRVAKYLLVLLLAAWVPVFLFSGTQFAVARGVTWAYLTAHILLTLLVVTFSAPHWKLTGNRAFAVLISGGAFTAASATVWLLAQPDVFIPGRVLGSADTVNWAYVLTEYAALLTLGCAGLASVRPLAGTPPRWGAPWLAIVGGAAGLLSALALSVRELPLLVADQEVTNLMRAFGTMMLVSCFFLLVANLRIWRRAPDIQAWIFLALAFQLSSHLAALGLRQIYDLPFYAMRVFSLLAAAPLLYALVQANVREHGRAEKADAALRELAALDPLTGLSNRTTFLRQAAGIAPPETLLAVVVLDLDGFKGVNDRWGTQVANSCLTGIGERLGQWRDHQTLVARLGDDEFALARRLQTSAEAGEFAAQISRAVALPLLTDSGIISLTASSGFAVEQIPPASVDDLLRRATMAMNSAKRTPGAVVAFTQAMADSATRNAEMHQQLLRGLANQEFLAWFQPLIDLRTLRMVGAEALARWPQPDGHVLEAGAFIPMAAATGKICELDQSVLASVITAAPQLMASAADPDFVITVNVSVGGLQSEVLFAQLVESPLVDISQHIVLEVVESAAVDAGALAALDRLRDCGYRVAVDDFGTGFSNLAAIGLLRPNLVKLDRGLAVSVGLEETTAKAVVRAACGLAEEMSAMVLLEGIETPAQLRAARELGMRFGQGYLFSKAIPAAELIARLRAEGLTSADVAAEGRHPGDAQQH